MASSRQFDSAAAAATAAAEVVGIVRALLIACLAFAAVADAAPSALAPPSGAGAPIIGGQGDFKYQFMPDKLALPDGAEIRDAHGLELDSANNIYLTCVAFACRKTPWLNLQLRFS